MTYTEKRLEKVDWREIDGAIMDFQIHVRKVTGGNNSTCVDSTDLKSAIKQTLTTSITQAIAEERERVREVIKSRKPNEYAVRYYKTMEARTWDEKNLVIEALDEILTSLQDTNPN